jgi:EmrB/QacA subfamily drug resistance transporter
MTRDQVVGLIVVMTGMAVAALDTTVVGTSIPTAIGDLGGIDRYSWVFSAYLLVATATTPVFGRISDIYGRKRVYFFALVVFMTASMLCGSATSMDQLIAFRALQGLGAGALISTGFTMLGDLFDARQRGRVQGFTASMWGTSAILGPAVGGILTEALSWRWAFFVNLPISLVAIVLLLNLHDREEHHGGSIDFLGAVTFAAAATSLLLGVSGTHPLIMIPSAILLALAFVAIERRTEEPLVDFALLRVPIIGLGLALMLLMGVMQFGATTYIPPFAQGVLGRSPIEAGIALGAMSLAWPIGALMVGSALMRIGIRRAVIVASVPSVIGTAVLATLGPAAPFALLVLGAGLVGLGQGVMNTPLLVGAQNAVGYGKRGVVTGLLGFQRSMGGAIGVAALGATLNATIGTRSDELGALLDPRGKADLSQAALDARAALAAGLHTVFVALLVLAAVNLVIALRMPTQDLETRAIATAAK